MKTQLELYYQVAKKLSESDEFFMELVMCSKNPITLGDLRKNIDRRPSLWNRYANFDIVGLPDDMPIREAILLKK